MSLLHTNLISIYDNHTSYNSFFPRESLYLTLREYFIKNIKDNNFIIDPLDYSYRYSLDPIRSLDLFLLLSQYGILNKLYYLKCDDCATPSIEPQIENFYECIDCKTRLLGLSHPNAHQVINNIKYVFEISDEMVNEISYEIKNLPPSSSFEIIEEEGYAATNVGTVLNNIDQTLPGIALEKEVLEILSRGIQNI